LVTTKIRPVNKTNHSKILYVDDDSDDCYFLKLSLSETGTDADLVCATDGEEAVKYLDNADNAELPALIVLDLNMPRWDGRRTLQYIKSHPRLASIPVVILSTSEGKNDQETFRQMGANSYIKKPFHYSGYKDVVRKFMAILI
jgi:CheY-like chemotaxis protein